MTSYSPDTYGISGFFTFISNVIGRCLMNPGLGDSTGILTIDLQLPRLLDVILRIKEVDSVVSDIDKLAQYYNLDIMNEQVHYHSDKHRRLYQHAKTG